MLYICIHTYDHTCVACYALACSRPSIDRHTHLSTCHYTSGTSVLCTVTLVKMTVSADARGYITRPIHATLIMAGIVIESRVFRPWVGSNLLLRHLRPTFARHYTQRRSWHKNVVAQEESEIISDISSIEILFSLRKILVNLKDLHHARTITLSIFICTFFKIIYIL